MKLGLGTAQFGLDYGLSNRQGKVAYSEVERILELALELNVRLLDTAPGYGDSESILGELLPTAHPFHIVTKTPMFKVEEITHDQVVLLQKSLDDSLTRLKQERIYGLLVHHANDLLTPGGELLVESLLGFIDQGRVSRVGVSIYTGAQIDGVLRLFNPGIVQLPLNVLDQRLAHSGHLQKLRDRGSEVHARSVFLQGLLLTEPRVLPAYFEPIRSHLLGYFDFLRENQLSPLEAAVRFVGGIKEVDAMILGVCSARQLRELREAAERCEKALPDVSSFALADPNYVNPACWPMSMH